MTCMARVKLKTTPLTPAIGAVVEGIDLRGPLSGSDIQEIGTMLDDRLVLFFENQSLTPERFAALGMEDRRDAIYAKHPPVSHPVARTNPVTGRKALFVNQDFTSHIERVSARESEALLRFLFEHMSAPEFQVRWRWIA